MQTQREEFFSKVYQGFKAELETREFLGLVLNLDQFKNIYQAILVAGIYLGVSALIATIFQPLAYLGAIVAFGMGIYSLFSAAINYAEPEKAKQMVIESAYCFGGYLALSFMPVFLSLVAVGSILYKSYDIFPHKEDIKQGAKTAWTGFKALFSQVEHAVDEALKGPLDNKSV
ncbi:MAG TPA: hypothetical protein DCZ80_06420 [Legionellales bacterium]|nr:hypothetical protein [Legionellales bacterium]